MNRFAEATPALIDGSTLRSAGALTPATGSTSIRITLGITSGRGVPRPKTSIARLWESAWVYASIGEMHTGPVRAYRERPADHAGLSELVRMYSHELAVMAAELGRSDTRHSVIAGVPVHVR